MYSFFSLKERDGNFTRLLAWLAPGYQPGASVGIVPDKLRIENSFGFKVVPALDCDILVGVETESFHSNPSEVLEPFKQSRAQKLYLFSLSWLTKSELIDAVLNVDSNLLDRSILLPNGAVGLPISRTPQFSLLVLDKARASEGRTNIVFIDATDMDPRIADVKDALENCPRVEKDFRNVILRHEPLLASYHCAIATLLGSIGEKRTTLAECATLTKSPSFLRLVKSDQVELACLSPADFEPFGYTLPPDNPERKAFPKDKINDEQILRGGDILLVAQSNVGKLCVIDPAFKQSSWTGTSFTWIVRPRKLDSRVLYLYLSSRKVQQYLADCSRRPGVPALPVQQLKLLPVPDFSPEQQTSMIKAFDELDDIKRSMAELSFRARRITQSFYT